MLCKCWAVQSGPDVLSERMPRNQMQDTDASREREALRRVWAGRVPRAVHTCACLHSTYRICSALQWERLAQQLLSPALTSGMRAAPSPSSMRPISSGLEDKRNEKVWSFTPKMCTFDSIVLVLNFCQNSYISPRRSFLKQSWDNLVLKYNFHRRFGKENRYFNH